MGQIANEKSVLNRANIRQLSDTSANGLANYVPAAGEMILISSDNSMTSTGQGNFDCYIVGDGTSTASALKIKSLMTIKGKRILQTYTASSLVTCGGTIRTADNKWLSSTLYYGALIAVSTYSKVKITGNATNSSSYAFVKSGFSSGNSVQYATGYSAIVNIPAGGSVSLNIPADAVYLYVYMKSNQTDFRPSSIEFHEYTEYDLLSKNDIVNNLSDGGNTKVLSAEMGKTLYGDITEKAYLNLDTLSSCGGTIVDNTNRWKTDNIYYGGLLYVQTLRGIDLTIVPNLNGNAIIYAFLKSGFNNNTTPDYCTGYSSVLRSSTNVVVEVPSDAVYLYVYMNSNGTIYTPSEIYYNKRVKSSISEIKEKLNDINDAYLDTNSLVQGSTNNSTGADVSDSNCVRTIYLSLGSKSVVECANNKVLSDGYRLYFKHTWYNSSKQFVSVSDWDYDPNISIPSGAIGGYDKIVISRLNNGTYIPTTPSDIAAYQLVFNIYGEIGLPYRVKNLENSTTLQDVLKGLAPNNIVICSWNIGHFSLGANKYSTINGTNYASKLQVFRELIYTAINPKVMVLCEYSEVFGTDPDNTAQAAKKVLFNDFGVGYEGFQYNYSCNAVYANTTLLNIERRKFACLQNETITHTNNIKATDYYYLLADLYLEGKHIKFVMTHLAFDNNVPSTLQVAQIQELISELSSYDRVILMGDWNVYAQSDFDDFVTAGYTLGNDGTVVTYPSQNRALDNIIVKGVTMTNFSAVTSSLSDHYPVVATISV